MNKDRIPKGQRFILPDGTSPPTGDAALTLRLFDPGGIRHGAPTRSYIARRLAILTKVAKTESEIESIISELVNRGFIEKYRSDTTQLEDGSFEDDSWYMTTPLGKKAARLCRLLAGEHEVGGTATSGDGLGDIIIESIGTGASFFDAIDAACCCARTEQVQQALEALIERQYVQRKGEGFFLSPPGLARYSQLNEHLSKSVDELAEDLFREVSNVLVKPQPTRAELVELESPNKRLPEELVGRFHIAGELGSGGFATVYLAIDNETSLRYALKIP